MTLKRRFLRALPTTTATDELQTILRRKWPCQSFSCPTDNSRLKTLLAIYTTDLKENASVILTMYTYVI